MTKDEVLAHAALTYARHVAAEGLEEHRAEARSAADNLERLLDDDPIEDRMNEQELDRFHARVDAAAQKLVDGYYAKHNNPKGESMTGENQELDYVSQVILGDRAEGGGGASTPRIRLKGIDESFSTKRFTGRHVKTGLPVTPEFMKGAAVETPSEWDKIRFGTYLRWSAGKAGLNVGWSALDRKVWDHIVNEDRWCGQVGSRWETGIRGDRLKAILDSTTSGGSYLSPAFFDAMVIETPLLQGELLPFTRVLEVPAGSAVEGASITAPTVTWGTAEGTASTAFDTASLISQTANSIHPCAVYVEVGRDLMSDTPINVATLLGELIGSRMRETLDEQIAVGDGTNEPEGIFTSSGTTSVSSASGTCGPGCLDELEELSLTAGKEFLVAADNPAFVCTMTNYRRYRQAKIGSGDARRLLGLAHSEFKLLEYDCKIQNDIDSGSMAFLPLRRYRLYKRQGMQLHWSTEGQTLMLKNTSLLAVRMRYGGFLELPAACCKMTDGPQTG